MLRNTLVLSQINSYFCSMSTKIALFTALFFISTQISLAQQILKGKVVRIADGDTMTVLDSLNQQHRIRLHGIDCPEKGQDYYQVAKDYLGSLCFQQVVQVQILKYDQYKRAIAKVYIDSTEINTELLKAGLAWHFTQFDKSEEYATAEAEARQQKLKLWSLKNPTAPWAYRKLKRQSQILKSK